MTQVVNCQPLTTEAWFSPCGNCGRQSGTETGFCTSSLVFPCQYHSAITVQAHVMLGMNDRPVDDHISETQSHPISIFTVRTSVVHIIVQSVLFRIWVLERLLVGSLIFGNILHCM
jgi:hypothetical protein